MSMRLTALLAFLLMGIMDGWLISLRCASSAPIDWSRLGFGLTIQFVVLCGALIIGWQYPNEVASFKRKASMVVLVAAALTFIIVRQPLLLSDTTLDKFYPSGSYSCPRVPQFWRPALMPNEQG